MIYEPREDSFLILKHIKDYAHGRVLDMGCGSGVLALEAMKYSKDVLGVDINIKAVSYCRKKGINSVQSDLFENVKGKFNLIIFNPPYLPLDKEEDEDSRLVTTGGKEGFELIERFFSEVKAYLEKDGKILLVFSSLTGDVDKVIKKHGFRFNKLDEEKLFFEKLLIYLI